MMEVARVTRHGGEEDLASDWREGAQDDLVLAVTLPCWYGEHQGGGPRMRWFESANEARLAATVMNAIASVPASTKQHHLRVGASPVIQARQVASALALQTALAAPESAVPEPLRSYYEPVCHPLICCSQTASSRPCLKM